MEKEKRISLRTNQEMYNNIEQYASETEKSINAAAKELIKIGYKAVNNSHIISDDLKRKIFNICGELETVDTFLKANDITYPNQKNLDNCLEEIKEEFIKWNF